MAQRQRRASSRREELCLNEGLGGGDDKGRRSEHCGPPRLPGTSTVCYRLRRSRAHLVNVEFHSGREWMRALLLTLLPLIASPALAQEKFVGTNMDTRTILNFRVSDAALQKLVPAGWEVNPATTGPNAGANAQSHLRRSDPDRQCRAEIRTTGAKSDLRNSGEEDRLHDQWIDDLRRAVFRSGSPCRCQHRGHQRGRAQDQPQRGRPDRQRGIPGSTRAIPDTR